MTEHAFPKRAVYVIDDDQSVRNALLRFISVAGGDALGFSTAEQFLTELPALAAGALVVDMQLPGMSGLELLRRLARIGVDWPAVVISGSHEGHEDAVSVELGPNRYLRKPFEPGALLLALHAASTRS